jgi:predicted DNA binding CopG/RHH family protein
LTCPLCRIRKGDFSKNNNSQQKSYEKVFIMNGEHDFELEIEEQEILVSYERDEWHSVADLVEHLRNYQLYAMEALARTGIQLSKEDVKAICDEAEAKGIPPQTLIGMILHQYVAGELVKKSRASPGIGL